MKLNLQNILLGILIVLIAWGQFFEKDQPDPAPTPIEVVIPEQKGSSERQYVEPKVVVVEVPVTKDRTIEVDSYWKEKYEQATQKRKDSLYNEAIKINKYQDTVLNDDRVLITGDVTTRGSLLDFKVDYTLKESSFNYVPEIITKRPDLSMSIGIEGAIPIQPNSNFGLKGTLGFENKKGNGITLGYDTNGTGWVGYKKTFTLKK